MEIAANPSTGPRKSKTALPVRQAIDDEELLSELTDLELNPQPSWLLRKIARPNEQATMIKFENESVNLLDPPLQLKAGKNYFRDEAETAVKSVSVRSTGKKQNVC
jgi:hypothetical protein